METLRLKENEIAKAAELIRAGELVAFPTETVYGLGADALNEEAVRSIYKAKGRPSDNPMIVHIATIEELAQLVDGGFDGVSDAALAAMHEFWPGPLTLVFRKSVIVPAVVTGGLDTVAVRMPAADIARQLIGEAGTPIAAPSANTSGRPSPTTAEDVLEDMDGRIAAVIMGEQCDVGIESTVVDMTSEIPTVLRPGIITAEWLSNVIGGEVRYDESLYDKHADLEDPAAKFESGSSETATSEAGPKSPGMKYKHYSPKAEVKLIEGTSEDFAEKAIRLGAEDKASGRKAAILEYGTDARKAAYKLFADLRELDREGYDVVYIHALEETGFGFSVMNRMLKSAGYNVISL